MYNIRWQGTTVTERSEIEKASVAVEVLEHHHVAEAARESCNSCNNSQISHLSEMLDLDTCLTPEAKKQTGLNNSV